MGIVICRKVANIRCEKVLYCMSLDNISLQLEQNHLLAVLVGTWTLSLKFKGRQTPHPKSTTWTLLCMIFTVKYDFNVTSHHRILPKKPKNTQKH